MSSGKHLIDLILGYSQSGIREHDYHAATDRIKAALLIHGSSSHTMWKTVEHLTWIDETARDSTIKRFSHPRGVGVRDGDIRLSELLGIMSEDIKLSEQMRADYPGLTQESLDAGLQIIWLLLRALEGSDMDSNPDGSDKDVWEKRIKNYERKLKEYRVDPEDYS